MIVGIAISVIISAVSIGGIIYIVRASGREIKKALEHYRIMAVDEENPIVPEAHIIEKKPLPVHIGEYTIYIQALTLSGYQKFISDFIALLKTYSAHLAGLRLLAYGGDEASLAGWHKMASDEYFVLSVLDQIDRAILRSKKTNPYSLTKKEILKKWSPIDILRVWQLIYSYQIDSIEDFTASLTGRLAGRRNSKAGSPSRRKQGSGSTKSQSSPLMPRYSTQKEFPSETSESPTK